jgi:L-aminopeptidase/D-esterase-like protein
MPSIALWALSLLALGAVTPPRARAETRPRARDLGIPFSGSPGTHNAITDVTGVLVGHTTLITGEGKLVVGQGPVRTGVTAILPKGRKWEPVFAGHFALNGFGDMTGTHWVDEGGLLGGPVMITNTWSVGVVRDAVNSWFQEALKQEIPWHQPVVGETWDGFLNDVAGQHIQKEHAFHALSNAQGGPVAEGNVGGGTGMVVHGFKGGIGTSSRVLEAAGGRFTVGVLVQANHGSREGLMVAGVPVGREIRDHGPARGAKASADREGSIIVVVATDAPLLPHQLARLARRVPLGIARLGGTGANGSGDIFLAFATANPGAAREAGPTPLEWLPNGDLSPFFVATIEATEEAIVNAMVAAETMTGIDGNTVHRLPHDRLREVLRKYGRLGRGEGVERPRP